MGPLDMDRVAAWIEQVVEAEKAGDEAAVEKVAAEVHEFARGFPMPGLTPA
jgi:glycine hydroxymethyltransferase